jgi:WXXGXW repeat (2 copies)
MRMNRVVSCLLSALVLMVVLSSVSHAQFGVGISVRIGPPPLPVYVQPLCPGEGYIWTPGYWAWDDDEGYYWVPGTWVLAPVGELWTPGYWGWHDGLYAWNDGYWGPHIGFYGGINYGFGYTGSGFYGGYWQGDRYFYNRSVNNVNVTNITNVYNKTVVVNNNTHVSYNGGNGGVRARPTAQQQAAAHEHHQPAIGPQIQHQQAAKGNRQLFASVNHGRPAVAATARPADFSHAVPARAAGGAYHAPKMTPKQAVANRSGGENRTSSAANARTNSRPATSRPTTSRAAQPNRSQAAPSRNSTRPETSRSTPSAARSNENKTAAARPAARATNRPSESRPAAASRPQTASRPASPRTNSQSAPARQAERPASTPRAASAPKRESAPPPRETRPAPVQHQAAPPRRESPPPQRQSAPPPQHQAAPPRHESAPPPRESAPKQERKPPGRG